MKTTTEDKLLQCIRTASAVRPLDGHDKQITTHNGFKIRFMLEVHPILMEPSMKILMEMGNVSRIFWTLRDKEDMQIFYNSIVERREELADALRKKHDQEMCSILGSAAGKGDIENVV